MEGQSAAWRGLCAKGLSKVLVSFTRTGLRLGWVSCHAKFVNSVERFHVNLKSLMTSLVVHFLFYFVLPSFQALDFLPLCDFPSTVIVSLVPDSSHLCSPPSCINGPCFPLSHVSSSCVPCVLPSVRNYQFLYPDTYLLFNCVFVTSLVSAFCYSFES